jgi:hypothetical protein
LRCCIWLGTSAFWLRRASYSILLAWEKIRTQNQSIVSTKYISLSHRHKMKDCELIYYNLRTIYTFLLPGAFLK